MIRKGRRFRGRRAIVALAAGPVLAAGLLAGLSTSPGQQSGDLDDQLAKVRSQIVDLKARLEAESRKEATVLSSLDRISLNKSILKSELDLYGLEMAKAGREQEALRKGLPALEAKLKKEKDSIAATLVTLYKYGRFNSTQFFFQSQDIRRLASESKSLTLLARYQQDVLHTYQVDLARLNAAQRGLELKREELSGLIEAARNKRRELEAEEARNKRRIDEIQQSKSLYQQTLNELNERAQQLQLLMDKLAKQEVEFPSPFIPLYERKGKLPWPLTGRVITRFGLERHPQFNTSTRNNGIEIAPETKDAVVRAVHGGRVVYADYFQGYGNLLILDHGLSYYSLYGHCASFLAKKGDWVAEAQPLALAGDVGSLKGVCLYLEIRYKAQPLNPLQWLERR
jgi:septal ring factor EnvC (AmiA/AmiB activator)